MVAALCQLALTWLVKVWSDDLLAGADPAALRRALALARPRRAPPGGRLRLALPARGLREAPGPGIAGRGSCGPPRRRAGTVQATRRRRMVVASVQRSQRPLGIRRGPPAAAARRHGGDLRRADHDVRARRAADAGGGNRSTDRGTPLRAPRPAHPPLVPAGAGGARRGDRDRRRAAAGTADDQGLPDRARGGRPPARLSAPAMSRARSPPSGGRRRWSPRSGWRRRSACWRRSGTAAGRSSPARARQATCWSSRSTRPRQSSRCGGSPTCRAAGSARSPPRHGCSR